jgi:hypothetical protein
MYPLKNDRFSGLGFGRLETQTDDGFSFVGTSPVKFIYSAGPTGFIYFGLVTADLSYIGFIYSAQQMFYHSIIPYLSLLRFVHKTPRFLDIT